MAWEDNRLVEERKRLKNRSDTILYISLIVMVASLALAAYLFINAIKYRDMAYQLENIIVQKNKDLYSLSNQSASYYNDIRAASKDCAEKYLELLDRKNNCTDTLISVIDSLPPDAYYDADVVDSMPFIKEALNFSTSIEYNKDYFNCMDFSRGAVDIAKSMGYDAYIKSVYVDCELGNFSCDGLSRHAIAIVEVPFEATQTFRPISPSEFRAYGLAK